jgi:hypothetical protein
MAIDSIAQRSARKVALMIAAKGDIEQAARSLDEVRAALTIWADELSTDAENLRQSAIGVQAEAIRATMSGLTMRAASERLNVVAQLIADEGGAS